MNNLVVSVERFLKNKNTVTILGVIVILVLLYVGYDSRIKSAVQPIYVPVASQTIQPRTEITESMVRTVSMPAVALENRTNVVRSANEVIGKYTNVNSVVPEGGMFYRETIVNKEELPDSVFYKVKEGEIAYNFPVNMESTYGNSIFPTNMIDIYMKAINEADNKVMLGKLVENVEVLAVKDSGGRNVFENSDEERTPSMMIFGLPEDIYLLMMKANYLKSMGVELYPVPHGGVVTSEDTQNATEVSTQQLKDYIEAHAINIVPVKNENTSADKLVPKVEYSNGTALITFPDGCGKDYACYYTKDGEEKPATKKEHTVTFKTNGILDVKVIEKNGTEHSETYAIDFEKGTATSQTPVNGEN